MVDDNHNAAEAMAAFLSFESMACRVAFGGLEAITIGVQAALALRQNKHISGIATVAFTALDEAKVCRHLADQEFDGYFQKGQSPANLLTLVVTFAHA
ncbi:hypothetical protein BSU04_07480 [Caballeronia sordidicola]|uniref:Response regulatory domain-containing protein n=1 Tax=Caballeronia sordidicola TaxID=196367 RepID=A0A226X7B7_CABSO|nr:hypothetical protein BSU04_07480 [Caballeronia sordidicola]